MATNVLPSPIARLKEFGYQEPPPSTGTPLPAAGGVWIVPHYTGFTGITNLASRSYRFTFDEAMYESPYNAKAMRRDPVLMSALRDRQIPTAMLRGHLEPEDESDGKQIEACSYLTRIVKRIKNFQQYRMHLLEAIWYGRYGVQNLYEYDQKAVNPHAPNGRMMYLADYVPINGDKLIFGWDKSIGILVNPAHVTGDIRMTERGRARFFDNREREALVINHFEPEDADFYDYEMSGSVAGVGVRGRLYWMWYLKTKVLTLLMNYLQRVALGFTIYYYQAGNPTSFNEVMTAAQNQVGGQAILFPRLNDPKENGPGIQRIEPSNSGAQLFEAIVTRYFDDIMRSYIMGQTLTTEAVSTGLGSGVAQAHEATFNRIVTYDAANLDATLTHELVAVLNRWNCPGNPCPRYVSDIEKPNIGEYIQAMNALYNWNVAIDVDDARTVFGISKPAPGHESTSLEKVLQMQSKIQLRAQKRSAELQAMMGQQQAEQQQEMAAQQQLQGQVEGVRNRGPNRNRGQGAEGSPGNPDLSKIEKIVGKSQYSRGVQYGARKLWFPSFHNRYETI